MVDDMRNRFDAQLAQLNLELIEMGTLCEDAIKETYKVLLNEDKEAAKEIIAHDSVIDRAERDIENLCLKLLLQQQPVAKDLRQVSAALKMITDMERIGDQAADIAEIVATAHIPVANELVTLKEMAEATMNMVTSAVDAYVKRDLDIAQKVIAADDTVDELFVKMKKKLLDIIHKNPDDGECALDVLMIAKYYERIGDHATNVAEWVEFSLTGVHKGA